MVIWDDDQYFQNGESTPVYKQKLPYWRKQLTPGKCIGGFV